jgi:RimJ/RimL family protein N-acetyltransferase
VEDSAFDRIVCERIVMRRFAPSDAKALAAYRSDPAVARYQAWEVPYAERDAAEFIASLAGAAPGAAGAWFQFAASLAGSDVLIGDCGLRTTRSDPRQAELGFTFASPHQRRGYATEAVRAVLGYAFGRLAMHRVFALTDARNAPAQRLLERVGFRLEGELRESVWLEGEWAAERLYALLASEWRR